MQNTGSNCLLSVFLLDLCLTYSICQKIITWPIICISCYFIASNISLLTLVPIFLQWYISSKSLRYHHNCYYNNMVILSPLWYHKYSNIATMVYFSADLFIYQQHFCFSNKGKGITTSGLIYWYCFSLTITHVLLYAICYHFTIISNVLHYETLIYIWSAPYIRVKTF